MSGILDGIRVLDFGRYIAGPYCAYLLGQLGAEVIRIDKIGGSEDRFFTPVDEDGEIGATFVQCNRGKKNITLRPGRPETQPILDALIASADVIVANMPDAALEHMGLDYATVTKIKPDVILMTATAYGSVGPWSDRIGFDGIGQLMSGGVYMSGPPEMATKSYIPWVDYLTATYSAFSTVAAIHHRSQTGQGQHIRAALLRTALSVANPTLIEQAALDVNRERTGNRAQVCGPADIFATKDGEVIVQLIGNRQFARLAGLLERPEMAEDPRFVDDKARGINRDALAEIVGEWCAARTNKEVLDTLAETGVPSGPLLAPADVLTHEHIVGTGFLADSDANLGDTTVPIVGLPVTMSGLTKPDDEPAPPLGRDTNAVLGDLGFSADEIAAFSEAGAI